MLEVFVLLTKKETGLHKAFKFLFTGLALAALVLNFVTPAFFSLTAIFGAIAIIMWRSFKEYEYSYLDGDFKFTMVINKSRRKPLLKLNMERVTQIAPVGDRCMYRYETDNTIKKYDFTSGNSEAKCYEILCNTEDGTFLVKIEPDEKFMDAVCFKNAQKVIR